MVALGLPAVWGAEDHGDRLAVGTHDVGPRLLLVGAGLLGGWIRSPITHANQPMGRFLSGVLKGPPAGG